MLLLEEGSAKTNHAMMCAGQVNHNYYFFSLLDQIYKPLHSSGNKEQDLAIVSYEYAVRVLNPDARHVFLDGATLLQEKNALNPVLEQAVNFFHSPNPLTTKDLRPS